MSDTPINQEPLEPTAAPPFPEPALERTSGSALASAPERTSGSALASAPDLSPESAPASAPDHSPESAPASAPEPHRAGLPDQKKNALLRYMAILFGVAFLLVLLSFLIQMRDSRETISDLSESKASALQNALVLQDENQALTEENDQLRTQLEAAQQQLKDAEEQAARDAAEIEELQTQLSEAQAQLNDMPDYYEFLCQAVMAYLDGDLKECYGLVAGEITPQGRAYLDPSGQLLYDKLEELSKSAAEP